MKSKKVTMLAAALVVAVVAAAGIGYAVTSYQATTENTNNSLDSTYITVTQGGSGEYSTDKFLTALYFNTANKTNASTITYTPVYDYARNGNTVTTTPDEQHPLSMALVSTVLTLNITPVNSGKTGNMAVSLAVTTDSTFAPVAGLTYRMAIVNEITGGGYEIVDEAIVTSTSTNKVWDFGDDVSISATAATPLKVVMFIEGESEVNPNGSAGFAKSTDVNKTPFTFTVTVPVTNA